MSTSESSRLKNAGLTPVAVATLVLGAALATWIVTVDRMRGMDAGPGTDLGGLGWYVGIWVTMMAAMMLPSVVPMAFLFSKVVRTRAEGGAAYVSPWIFLAGYLAAWTAYGLAAYGVFRGIRAAEFGFLAWDEQGPIVAGVAVASAGLYQLTPLKRVCLKHCRGPLHFLLHGWHEGRLGAARMGAEHGAYCVGCCWGLMIVLFVLGVMSLFWMAVVAAVIFAEKVLPFGGRLTQPLAIVLVALGIWIASAPDSVPGLTEPGTVPPAMQMQMKDEPGASPPAMPMEEPAPAPPAMPMEDEPAPGAPSSQMEMDR